MLKCKINICFGIDKLEDVIESSDLIPKGQLHVRKGTYYAEKLAIFKDEVSFALLAIADRIFDTNYAVGFSKNARVILNDIQAAPVMINHGMVARAKKHFGKNQDYPEFEFEVISPPIEKSEYALKRGVLYLRKPCLDS